MQSSGQQNKTDNSAGFSASEHDVSAIVGRPDNPNRNKRILLLVLLIMIFSVAQIIILFSSTAVQQPADVAVERTRKHIENIEVSRDELVTTVESLEEVELDEQFNDAEASEAVQSTDTNLFGIEVPMTSAAAPPEEIPSEEIPIEKASQAIVQKTEPAVPQAAVLKPVTVNRVEEPKQQPVLDAVVSEPEYIKYDGAGNILPDESESWVCVRDTNTDLMWEIKTHDDKTRDPDNLYSWYRPEHEGATGESDGGRCKGDVPCDTNAYIEALNEQNLCGHDDWKLPTREQMQTLVDLRDGGADVKINNRYFPYTKPSWYWTSTGKEGDIDRAWYVLFRNGFALSDLKERPKHIRLVRKNNPAENL